MERTKRILTFIIVVLMISVIAIFAAGCSLNAVEGEESFRCIIVVKANEENLDLDCLIIAGSDVTTYYSASFNKTESKTVKDILDYLTSKTDFNYAFESSSMGAYITGIYGIVADISKSQYFAFYVDGIYWTEGISSTEIENDITIIEFILSTF